MNGYRNKSIYVSSTCKLHPGIRRALVRFPPIYHFTVTHFSARAHVLHSSRTRLMTPFYAYTIRFYYALTFPRANFLEGIREGAFPAGRKQLKQLNID